MRPTHVEPLHLMSTLGHPDDSVNPKEVIIRSWENMEDEEIFPNQDPLRDLKSLVQYEDRHYQDE